jgi:hypothetical protein
MKKHLLLFSIITLFMNSSCSTKQEAPKDETQLVATIKDIMDSEIGPSADYIWGSIGEESGPEGIIKKAPKTDDEWKEERRKAVILVEAANLIVMPGRHVAKAGEKAADPNVELSPEAIEELINKDREAFLALNKQFRDVTIEQLAAIDKRDVDGMLKAGGELDTTCENCHKKYWYPNDPHNNQQ